HRARLLAAKTGQPLQADLERLAVDPKQHRGDLVGVDAVDIADEAQGDVIIFGVDPAGAGKAAPQIGKGLADLGRNFQSSEQTRHRTHSRCLGMSTKPGQPRLTPTNRDRRITDVLFLPDLYDSAKHNALTTR